MSTRSRSAACAGLSLAVSLLVPSSALAWPSVDPAATRTTLLGGRWSVIVPADATPAVAATPNGPALPQELDGLLLVTTPEGHFALRGTVLESTRPEDLAATLRTLPAPCAAPTYGTLGDRTDVVTIRCTDVSPDGAFRPVVAYAVHADGWVDRIETLIETTDPDDAAARSGGVAYAEAVLATLRAEDAAPAVERGEIEIVRACESGADADPLTLTLPEGWVATRDTTEGAERLRITQVVPLGAARPTLAVELAPAGTPPRRVPDGVGVLVPRTLLGRTIDWLVLEGDAPTGVRQVATEISIDCGDGGRFARALWLSLGGPRATLDNGQHVLETLALGGTRAHRVELEVVSSQAPPEEDVAIAHGDADEAAASRGQFWSMVIGGASLLLLAAALVMRSRTTRPK